MKKKIILYTILFLFAGGGIVYYGIDETSIQHAEYQNSSFYPFKAGKYGQSYLELNQGIPVLHLYGTAFERGKATGYILNKQINVLIKQYIHVFFSQSNKYQIAIKNAFLLEKFIPKEYLEEMKGISEASGLPYKDILLTNTFLEMHTPMLCSTFVSHSSNTQGGELMFGRNLDFPSLNVAHLYDLIVIHHSENGSKYDVMSITWPGLIGIISGMNEHGLTATMLVSLSEKHSSTKRIPSTLAFRRLLESKKTVKDSIDFFSKTKIASPNNLTIADSHDQSVVLELSPFNKTGIIHPKNQTLYCTNYFLTGKNPTKGFRYKILRNRSQTLYKKGEKINLSILKKILKDVALGASNLQSMIWIPSLRKLYLSMESIPAASGLYKEIDLKLLFRKRL